ncbi:4-hydroxy-tetrahydrodipicolinate synthase [Robertkochia marina]|uniref:4-hydroxy-tetrahydrodipicolinate synthase n=1 Tax=Robertkochia marina TaxID=1227945 RepID=A0A4S3M202_9FLAO|nr:4-hydroxy-tetrahydrodipicolinate synthase [Robertkochia marina]THD68053.1 4-hydroxy-tetrahydrodipicolinate synthase [Robertkochia marina]TRZ42663.1 4-hydroxy-tetrahydrodipicolinate synthase [Robertkochia marina]
MKAFKGTGVALITPFREDLSVDTRSLERLVEYVIAGGVDYLVVLGTTAEAATLNSEEKKLVKETVVAANKGRLPLVLGVGSNNTSEVVEALTPDNLQGYDAVLSVSPYYNKPTQEGIYRHFEQVALNSSLPVILYNVPGRTASNMLPETVVRLANDFENIIGIKEAAGDMVQAMRLLKDVPDNFMVISGDDMLTLPMVAAGGAGVISVIGQGLPEKFSSMVVAAGEAHLKKANALHFELMDVIDYIFEEGNPAGIKSLLHQLDVIESPAVRLPLVEASEGLRSKISKYLQIGAALM